ncbi:hypothetical protein [Paraconexibacter sp. AEG42_29]|uniref:hypothetical protein n=1 Tax=Paraconexibacter sp. AEG42_29 TaxID=2997339 RepID=UPI00339D40E4
MNGLTVIVREIVEAARPNRVEVRLEIVDDDEFARRLSAWDASFRAWGARRDQAGRPCGDPPAEPAAFLNDIDGSLTDDCNTAYRWDSKRAGGSGTERDAQWSLTPAPPAAARVLTLTIGHDAVLTWYRSAGNTWE